MTNQNPFDFNNLDDLPEDLREKLTASTNGSVDEIVSVIAAGKEAGFDALTLNQIKAAGMRMGIEMPTDATIRAWLKTAEEQGKVSKPSRQTYAVAGTVAAVDAAEVDEPTAVEDGAAPEVEEDDDPLAGL